MVNTRKGTYAAKSSKVILEAQISKTFMHGVRMGGHVFYKGILINARN